MSLPVSVVVCAYTMDRWDELVAAVASLEQQTPEVPEIIVVIDHNPALLERAARELPAARCIANEGANGASAARNTGVAAARGQLIAFLDDDAYAEPQWLDQLVKHLEPDVLGAGGMTVPSWCGAAPEWFPPEFYWVIGATHTPYPRRVENVRNVWSCNMILRRADFMAVGGFSPEFGKVGIHARPEDTELCLRLSARRPDIPWRVVPSAVVKHNVPKERTTWKYFLRRCYLEGEGKALLEVRQGATTLSTERKYVTQVLLRRITAGVFESPRRAAMARSIAITFGLLMTVLGYVVGRLGAQRLLRTTLPNRAAKA